MREMIKMVVVLTVLSAFSGGLLAAIKEKTSDRIESQKLEFVKGPAVREIFEGSSNDPIADRFTVDDQGVPRQFFVGKFDGKANSVAFETTGKGFGGNIGVMIGVGTEEDKILGVRVTTHQETPGVGARAKTELDFVSQFAEQSIADSYKVKPDGGQVDALSGATVTSRGVSAAMTEASDIYRRLKPQIQENLKRIGQ